LTYQAAITFARTPAEYRDPFLSWERDDKSFFAAGACHILAYLFCQLHSDTSYQRILISPHKGYFGHHMYVTDGTWALDYAGWTMEAELLEETERAMDTMQPQWSCDRLVIAEDIETFCSAHNHRPPSHFPDLPWRRAYAYLATLPDRPPST
jgi:hypothetical protein